MLSLKWKGNAVVCLFEIFSTAYKLNGLMPLVLLHLLQYSCNSGARTCDPREDGGGHSDICIQTYARVIFGGFKGKI